MSELHDYFIKNLREMTFYFVYVDNCSLHTMCVISVPTDEWSTRLFYLSCTCLTTAPETITLICTYTDDQPIWPCHDMLSQLTNDPPMTTASKPDCTTCACAHIQSTTDCTYWTWPTNTTMIIIMIHFLKWPSKWTLPLVPVYYKRAHTSHQQHSVPTVDQPI